MEITPMGDWHFSIGPTGAGEAPQGEVSLRLRQVCVIDLQRGVILEHLLMANFWKWDVQSRNGTLDVSLNNREANYLADDPVTRLVAEVFNVEPARARVMVERPDPAEVEKAAQLSQRSERKQVPSCAFGESWDSESQRCYRTLDPYFKHPR